MQVWFSLGHIEGESAGNPEETLVSSVSIREEGVRDNIYYWFYYFRLEVIFHSYFDDWSAQVFLFVFLQMFFLAFLQWGRVVCHNQGCIATSRKR